MSRWAKRVATVLIWAVLGFGLGMVASITVPSLLGYRSMTVLSGSMEPRSTSATSSSRSRSHPSTSTSATS